MEISGAEPDVGATAVEFSSQLRRLRKQAKLTQGELATRTTYTRPYIARAEKPGGTISKEAVQIIDDALAAGGALIALHEQAVHEKKSRRRHLALSHSDLTKSLNATISAFGASAPPGAAIASVLGPEHALENIRALIDRVILEYETQGPETLFVEVVAARRACIYVGENWSGSINRILLINTAARLAGLLSYMCVNLSMFHTAETYAAEAKMMAEASNDRDLLCWIGGTRSFAAYYTGNFPLALRYADSALSATGRLSEQRARILSNGVARAAGKLGYTKIVDRAVGESIDLAEGLNRRDCMTPCIDFSAYSPMRTRANAATAFLSLGQTTRALELTGDITSALETSESRWSRALVGLDEAMALAGAHPERSAELGIMALNEAQDMPITSVQKRSTELVDKLARFHSLPAVANFVEQRRDWPNNENH